MISERLLSRMTNFPLSPRSPDLTIYDAFMCYAEIPVFPTNSKKNWTTKIKQQTIYPISALKWLKYYRIELNMLLLPRDVIACMHVISVYQFVRPDQ